jgi:hypothetical protein
MTMALAGLEELRAALYNLRDGAQKKAAKAAINAGLQQIVRGVRNEVNGATISPELKAAVRRTIGKSLKKKGDDYLGKAGFGLAGGHSKTTKARDAANPGVGVSASNVHWFVLGTQERFAGIKGTGRGHKRMELTGKQQHRTGQIQPVFAGYLARACESSADAILLAAGEKLSQVLLAEAQKG